MEVVVSLRNRTVLRIVCLILLSALAVRFIANVEVVLGSILIACFLGLALNPAVNLVQRRLKLNRLGAIVAVYFIGMLLVITVLWALVAPLANQTSSFVHSVPTQLEELKTGTSHNARLAQKYHLGVRIDNLSAEVKAHTKDVGGVAVTVLGQIGDGLVTLITVLIMAALMLLEGPTFVREMWNKSLRSHKQHYEPLVERMYGIITGYVNGQLLISLIGALMTLIVLLILRVPNALLLSAIIFFTGLIPLIGHPIGAGIVSLLTLFSSPSKAVVVLIYFVLFLQLQSTTLQPYIQSRKNELTPLTVFIAALLGIEAAGFIGAFIAIPLAGCLKIVITDYLETSGTLKS